MLNPQDRQKSPIHKIAAHGAADIYKQRVLGLQSALQKASEHRSPAEHQAIREFAQGSAFCRRLTVVTSAEFVQDFLTRSKVYYVHGKKRIYEKGQRTQFLVMPLLGKCFLAQVGSRAAEEQLNEDQSFKQLYRRLLYQPHEKQPSTFSLSERRNHHTEVNLTTTAVPHWQELRGLIPVEGEGTLMLANENLRHRESLYVGGEAWILGIQPRLFSLCLAQEYDRILSRQAAQFRSLRCFDILSNQELKALVEEIDLLELGRDQLIYREGELSSYLYLLVAGEVKASKKVSLFEEDPNLLYEQTVRARHAQGSPRLPEVPYVNFQGVYHYSPEVRKIELGILTPIAIFGEEEVLGTVSLPRQVELQVTSNAATVYRFTLKDLEATASKYGKKINTAKFLKELFDAFTLKRIVARRQAMGRYLELEGRRNMNYFYLESPSPISRPSRNSIKAINRSVTQAKTDRPKSAVKPRYHGLNFNEFLEQGQPQNNRAIRFSKEQRRVAQLTHNSSDIADKVSASCRLSARLGSFKHKIDVYSPLFEGSFYLRQRKEALRIQNKRRMNNIVVSDSRERPRSSLTRR